MRILQILVELKLTLAAILLVLAVEAIAFQLGEYTDPLILNNNNNAGFILMKLVFVKV